MTSPASDLLRPLTALALGCLALCVGCQRDSDPPPPPNVLILSIDTFNRDALRAFNPAAPEHPNFDKFATGAARLQNAYTTSSWTLPSHASLMTGLYPHHHGAVHVDTLVDAQLPRLASMLRDAGLQTIAFTDGGYVARAYGFDTGFERYDRYSDPDTPWAGPELPRGGHRSKLAGAYPFDRAITYLRDRPDPKRGFFLFLHTYMVHNYFEAHPWAVQKLPPFQDDAEYYRKCLHGAEKCSPEQWDRLRSLYDAEVQRADAALGQLLNVLEDTGELENTLILLMSDHGEGFDPAHNRIHHGGRLNEDLIRIPLMAAGPGIRPGDYDHPTSLTDVFPTFAELLGREAPPDLDGRSFAPVLSGRRLSSAPVFAAEYYQLWKNGQKRYVTEIIEKPVAFAIIDRSWWYIRHGRSRELYDMSSDPRQQNNLFRTTDDADRFSDLENQQTSIPFSTINIERDPELEAQLRALGYVH